MANYFYDLLPAEEMSQLKYIPTVPEFVEWIEQKWGDLTAATSDTLSITYNQMCERIARRRHYLGSLGLQKGDKVAIWEKTSIDAVEVFLAALSAGYVGIMLPASLPEQAIVGGCQRFGVKVLAARDEFASKLSNLPCKLISSAAMSDEKAPVAVVDKEDPAAIFFTGGTTGQPKGVVLPHRALMRGSFNGVFSTGPQLARHRIICFLPLNHVFGLIRSTMGAFYVGANWYPAADIKETLTKIPVIKPTLLVLVPGLCDILYGLTKVYGAQFLGGELSAIIAGAACVPPRLIEAFQTLGITLLEGYGMTEGANLTAGNVDVLTKPTSVGKIYPEQEVKIVDGEIWIKGDNLFTGYYNDEAATKEVLTEDGWLKTGDLGRFDEEGYLYITGRIKNIILLDNGENISPEEIEEPFYKCAALKDCLVGEIEIDGQKAIGIEIYPQMPAFEGKAWEEVEAFFTDLVDKVNSSLPSTHRIQKVVVRKEDFKRTASLKVSRNQQ